MNKRWKIKKEIEIGRGSEIRESNPPHRLGKPVHYRCANLAKENTNAFHKKEPRAGLEPATHALRMRCSTN